jgi:hypothetical protein
MHRRRRVATHKPLFPDEEPPTEISLGRRPRARRRRPQQSHLSEGFWPAIHSLVLAVIRHDDRPHLWVAVPLPRTSRFGHGRTVKLSSGSRV